MHRGGTIERKPAGLSRRVLRYCGSTASRRTGRRRTFGGSLLVAHVMLAALVVCLVVHGGLRCGASRRSRCSCRCRLCRRSRWLRSRGLGQYGTGKRHDRRQQGSNQKFTHHDVEPRTIELPRTRPEPGDSGGATRGQCGALVIPWLNKSPDSARAWTGRLLTSARTDRVSNFLRSIQADPQQPIDHCLHLGCLVLVVLEAGLIHVIELRQLELHCLHSVVRATVVTGDIAALEAAVDGHGEARLRFQA